MKILSLGNSKKENKYELYEESGVREYRGDPMEENILIFVLEDEEYRLLKPVVDDFAASKLFQN